MLFMNDNCSNVLIVEDDEITQKTLSKYLQTLGYDVKTAINGKEALEILNQTTIDLVLTDIKMPVMDGKELLKHMAVKYGEIPRIVLTAHDNEEDILFALKNGAFDYFVKPIVEYDLIKYAINRALNNRKLQLEKEKSIHQMEHANRVISLLNKSSSVEEIFTLLHQTLSDFIPFERISILDFLQSENRLVIKYVKSSLGVSGEPGDSIEIPAKYVKALTARRETLIVDNIDAYFHSVEAPLTIKKVVSHEFRSFLSSPLIINDVVRGFMVLASSKNAIYNEDHGRLLTLLAGQIAFSLQRSDLLHDLSIHTKNLEEIVKKRTEEVISTQKTTIFALSKLAEMRDTDTGEHLERMRNYSLELARLLKYTGDFPEINKEFLDNIYDSSILHDIGKVGISDSILLKEGPLTKEEFAIMKTHAAIGYNALNAASKELGHNSFLEMSKDIALFHHEQYDGNGYPTHLKGNDIPLSARIVTISDIYDALTIDRSYKKAFSHKKAVSVIKEESYRFDPRILKVFLENNNEFDRIRQKFS
jgi:response regulator RpfG family c-di-GMP phosphodiesterase